MKIGTKEVKSSKEKIGDATFNIYDSVQEGVDNEGESVCLGFINAQVRTNAMNTLRGSLTGKPSKNKLQIRAMNSISTEELMICREKEDSEAALNQLIQQKINELMAEEAEVAGEDGEDVEDVEDDEE